jgi:hypothetical protein
MSHGEIDVLKIIDLRPLLATSEDGVTQGAVRLTILCGICLKLYHFVFAVHVTAVVLEATISVVRPKPLLA